MYDFSVLVRRRAEKLRKLKESTGDEGVQALLAPLHLEWQKLAYRTTNWKGDLLDPPAFLTILR